MPDVGSRHPVRSLFLTVPTTAYRALRRIRVRTRLPGGYPGGSRHDGDPIIAHRVGSKPRDYHGFDMYRSAFSVKSAESGVVLDSLVADMMLVRFSIWDCA